MASDLALWIPVVSTAIGGLIGFGSAWIGGSLQANREKEKRSEERLDRDRRELREAYHRWFAVASDLSLRSQLTHMQTIQHSPEETAKLAEAMLAGLREGSTVFHGVLILETNQAARQRMGGLLGEISKVGAKQLVGDLSFGETMKEWAEIHKQMAEFQEWLVLNRFGGAK